MTNIEKLGQDIFNYRGKNALTQNKFAEICGVNRIVIIKLEQQKVKPTAITVAKIEKVIYGNSAVDCKNQINI
ncbi:MAG: helix-turn-helix transcriptional regulator [Clostridia bacterium]